MPPRDVVTPESFGTLGALLRHLRHRAHLTQRDLAIAVGYDEAHISRLERNQRKLDRAVLTARFVPALELEREPDWVARLLELAEDHASPPAPSPHPTPESQGAPAAPALLMTKLHIPAPRKNGVARPRLTRRLDDALACALTLIVAPAGFGKSTLLAAWIAALGRETRDMRGEEAPQASSPQPATRVAWLALDAEDNDLATFVRYLVAALRQFAPEAGAETLAMLRLSPPARVLLAPLVNDLAGLAQECVLVLDDCHVVTNPAAYEALSFLLEHQPARLHLVIAARSELPLPLARLRARGQLLELRAADLRFDGDEAAVFMRETMQLTVSDAEIASLEARAEGWAAGLQLAALALRQASDQAAFVRAFAGSNRYVLDYLAEEVLDHLPVYLRHFLLQTSVLERLCGPLCDAVLGVGGDELSGDSYSQVVLAELERRSLFLIPLDGERRWYRYHHLFAEVLRERLAAGSSAAMVGELHRRASAWFHRQALPGEAIHHAVRSHDLDLVAELVEHYLEIGLSRNDYRVWSWFAQVPAEVVRARPRLALQAVDLLGRVDRYDEALRLLDSAPALQAPASAEVAAGAALMRARIWRLRLTYDEARVWLRQALALAPEGTGTLQAILALERGLLAVDLDEALEYTGVAARRFRALGHDGDAIFALYQRLMWLFRAGRMRDALAESTAALQEIARMDEALSARFLGVMQVKASVLIEQDRLDEAAGVLDEAWRLAKSSLEWVPSILLCWRRARYAYARGDPDAALAVLEEGHRLFAERGGDELHEFMGCYVTQAHLWRGDVAAAAASVPMSGSRLDLPIAILPYVTQTTARVLIAQGRGDPRGPFLDEAQALLERCEREIDPRLMYWVVTTQALRALLHHARGDMEAAVAALAPALAFGEQEGLVRLFADEGAPMGEILREARRRGIRAGYCGRLLAAFPLG